MDLSYDDLKLKNEKKIFEYAVGKYEYSKVNTLLSNERTFYSYIRTGLAICGFAFKYKSKILAFIGCIFFICGFYNYFTLAKKVEDDKIKYPNKYLPIVLTVVSLFAVYLIIDKEKLL
jgi:hypothetical protein